MPSPRRAAARPASAAIDSGALIATNASTRQPSRSVSEASARRHSVPVCWVGAGSGGMCASSRRLAWRRSTSARRAQTATAASTSGSPIQIALSAAPSTSTAVVSAQTRPSGSESVEVLERLDGVRAGGGRSRSSRARRGRWSRPAPDAHVAARRERLDLERRVVADGRRRGRCGGPRRSRRRPGSARAARARRRGRGASAAAGARASRPRPRGRRRRPRGSAG